MSIERTGHYVLYVKGIHSESVASIYNHCVAGFPPFSSKSHVKYLRYYTRVNVIDD